MRCGSVRLFGLAFPELQLWTTLNRAQAHRFGGASANGALAAFAEQGGRIMLSPYRVVDLTDEGAMICGQILGDLGADVILLEPSAGAQARQIGPYVDDLVEENRSLNFWSLNRNKRSVTPRPEHLFRQREPASAGKDIRFPHR